MPEANGREEYVGLSLSSASLANPACKQDRREEPGERGAAMHVRFHYIAFLFVSYMELRGVGLYVRARKMFKQLSSMHTKLSDLESGQEHLPLNALQFYPISRAT